jgi:hypothetical protein
VRKVLDVYPVGGMITSIPPKELPLHASPDMLNMAVYAGRLRKRPGYTQFRTGNTAFADPVMGLASVQDEENGTHLFAFTETELWKYDGSADWDVMSGPAFTGGERLFSWEVSQNALVASQGIDQVIRMPFTGTAYAILNANCPAAEFLTRAADRLVLASTFESAARKPFRVRRSVASDHTDWTGVGSGFTDLSEFPYHIKNIRKLGAQVVVYTEKSINLGTRTGDASAPIAWQPGPTEVGLLAPFTLKGRRSLHNFLGNDDWYEFDGATLQGYVSPVRDDIFGTLNASALRRMFAETISETQEVLNFLCMGASETPDYVWVHNYGRRIWYPWTVSGPSCACLHRLDSSTTWDSLTGTWDSYPIEWDSYTLQQSYPALLTGHTDGKVYIWGRDVYADSGQPIRCYWSSKDFHSGDVEPSRPGMQVTLHSLGIWYQDQGVDFDLSVYYSTDGGSTWQGPYAQSVEGGDAGMKLLVVDRQVSGNTVRVRLEQNSASQTLIIGSVHPDLEIRGMRVTA